MEGMGIGGQEGRTQLEIARCAIQQQGLLQPRIIWLCFHALGIKSEGLPVPLSFEIIVALFLEVLDLLLFLVGFRMSTTCTVQ